MKILSEFMKRESQQFSSNELIAQRCIEFLKKLFTRIKCGFQKYYASFTITFHMQ